MAGWTRFVLRHRRSVLAFWIVVLLAGGLRELEALGAALEHVRGARNRLGARSARARSELSATAPTARSPSSSSCRMRNAPRSRRPRCGSGSRRPSTAPRRRSRAGRRRSSTSRARRPARSSSTATSSRRSTSPRRRGTRTGCCARSGTRPGVEHVYVTGAGRDPARPRPDLQPGPEAGRVRDRAPDRAARPARRVRALLGGDDPVHLRRLHDHRHARDRLLDRPPRGDADLRDEPRPADRARDRRRLLAADRLPLPRGARGRAARSTTPSCGRWRPPAARSSSPGSRSRSGSRCSSRCRCRSCG